MIKNQLFEMDPGSYDSPMVSKMRINREYLLSEYTASELNTYTSFTPFSTFNDLFGPAYSSDGTKEETPDSTKMGALGVRSLFNKAGAVVLGSNDKQIITNKASDWRIANNVPLMDNRINRQQIRANSGCTVKELVEASQRGELGRNTYSFSDFMYCKYLGKIPNNYMVTLRRFPYPVDDYISNPYGTWDDLGSDSSSLNNKNIESLGCLITWMGTPGNDMSNILKYTFKMPFKEQTAQLQDSGVDADSGGGPANAIAAAFDPAYRKQYMSGQAGASVNKYVGKYFPVGDAPYPASQWNSFRDNTKIYGPVDTIKTTYVRSDEGLTFNQTISLVFEYELRSYNGINGRQAFLDLLSNILNVTYTTGTFWGGGFRGGGAHQNNIFTNLNVFKVNGGATDFIDALSQDYTTLSEKAGNAIKNNGGLLQTIKTMLNQLGGMLIGGMLNKLGRPMKSTAHSMLSPAPIGFWHVTIGNPHHPIMSVGNMILTNAGIEHYGPLGLDDFPTGIRVVCELTRGKTRDLRDIEKLYMHGNDRIYTPMGPKIFDMYEHAKEFGNYKSKKIVGNPEGTIKVAMGDEEESVSISNIGNMKNVLQKYFGQADTNSIIIASMEQEMGAHKKKKKGTAGGDSSAQGN